MGLRTGTDRREQMLFPPSFDDYVSCDNPVRVIDEFVESVELKELGLEQLLEESVRGAPRFDPRALLKLYVYGYSNRIRSSRELEKATHRNVEVIWLVKGLRPDHWTINELRKQHPGALKLLFKQFHLLCRELGLVGSELVALDSSFFKGSVNASKIQSQSTLKSRIEEADRRIEAYMKLLETAEPEESKGGSPDGESVAVALRELRAKREALKGKLAGAEASPTGQHSEVDPDSRLLRKSGKTVGGYQVQASVDADSHLIVDEQTMRGGTDREQLAPMAARAREALGAESVHVVADGGYYSEEALEQCEGLEGVQVYVPVKKERGSKAGLYPKEAFSHDAERDVVVCPQGKCLPRKSDSRPKGDDRLYHTYYEVGACRNCPVRAQCTKGKYRKIHLSVRRHLSQAMHKRMESSTALYAKRASTAEHPFGTMKFWMQGYALMTRSHKKVSGEISLTCLCYNIKRAIKMLGIEELLRKIREIKPANA